MDNAQFDAVREAFGKILRTRRLALELSQEELAGRAGIAMRYVSLLEGNKRQPTLTTLYGIASALELTLGEFMTLIENEMKPRRKR